MDIQKLITLLSHEEGPKLDFKLKLNIETEGSKKELAKDICAIANSRGGRGYIIFGVEDKTKHIIGIEREDFQEEQIQQVVSTRLDPPVPITVDLVPINGLLTGVITIFNTDHKPHQMRENGAFYTRRGSTTDIMRKDEIASMLQEVGLLSYELIPLTRASKNDMDFKCICDFLLKSGFSGNIDDSILISSGIFHREKDYNEIHPTCGGMLLFGHKPQDYMPHAIIKIFNNLDPRYPYHHISSGNIMNMLEDAVSFIGECLGGTLKIPMVVIEDLLGKAVLHRDYLNVNRTVEVYISEGKVEISNPGTSKRDQSSSGNKYVRRNSWLYLKLLTMDNKNRFFHKNINPDSLIQFLGRIKYYNVPSKNIFKAVIIISKNKNKFG